MSEPQQGRRAGSSYVLSLDLCLLGIVIFFWSRVCVDSRLTTEACDGCFR